MTICMAAIADNKDIIALTDKEFTVTHGVVSSYEIYENKKSTECTNSCVALFAGDIREANAVLKLAGENIESNDTVEQVALKIQQAYNARLKGQINQQILGKFGLDINTFNQQQLSLDATFVNSVIQTVDSKTLGVDVIIAGKDGDTPQLIKMLTDGTLEDHTYAGFVCIGSGAPHAKLALLEGQCHPAISQEKLLYAMVKAKRKAELDPHVGEKSDMIIMSDKTHYVEDKVVKALFLEYDESVKKSANIIQKSSIIMKGHIDGTTSK